VNNPLVSIIIPVYNGADYMREAIDSALSQTYDNCEVIVINDGSKDNTEEIALSYGNKIRYFAKENGGVSTALNLGIEKMRGEYFSWLSHDDTYYPNKIEKQINALRDCGDMTRIAWGDFDIFDENTKQIRIKRFSEIDNEKLLTDSIFPVLKAYTSGCTILIHRSQFQRIGMFKPELRYTQDYDLWFRMFREQKTVYINEPLYRLRIHSKQGTITEATKMRPEEVLLWLDFIRSVTHEEADRMFGNMYEFYRYMYMRMKYFDDKNAIQTVYKMFLAEPIPPYIPKCIDVINHFFSEITHEKAYQLCIFCAGIYGKTLYYELETLNIKVQIFADNDSAKHGKDIVDGVKCLSFDELLEMKNKTLVIVAKEQPDDITEQLGKANFPFITTKQELDLKISIERVGADKGGYWRVQ